MDRKNNWRNDHITVEEFITRARAKHGDKYDYSLIKEIPNNHSTVIIICPIHGQFEQRVDVHLRGFGCKKCSGCQRYTTEKWIEKAKDKRGVDLFGYDKVVYINARTKVSIFCKIHSVYFEIKPNDFLHGHGCPICNQSHLENDLEKALKEHLISFKKQAQFDWLGLEEKN